MRGCEEGGPHHHPRARWDNHGCHLGAHGIAFPSELFNHSVAGVDLCGTNWRIILMILEGGNPKDPVLDHREFLRAKSK